MCRGSTRPGYRTVPRGNSGSVSLMLRHYAGRRLAASLVLSGVVVDGDLIRHRQGLAGQHVARGNLGLIEGEVTAHPHLPGPHLRPAGAADAALAGERQVGP